MATMDARTQNVRTQSPRVLLWLIAIGFFMETLDSTIVNTALPSMAQSLGESPLMMQSVIISYTLTLAVFIPASGFLADRFGTEKTYFAAILLFTLGPTLGGWLVEYASWHWIFLINIPIGVVGCVATWFSMPESESQPDRRFDLPGFIQVSLFMVAVLFAFDGLSELNLSHGTVLLLFFLGLASLVSYILRASRVENPLFALNLFKVRTFTVGILGNLFARVGSSGMPFLIPLFLQLSLGASPFQAGLTMLPLALSAIVAKRFVSPIVRKIGYRNFLIYNTLAVGFGMASFALMTDQQSTWLRIIQLLLFGTVNSMQFTAMNTLTLKDLDRAKASGGNALFSMVQMLSLSFAVAVAGALLSAFMERFDVHLHPEMALRAFHAAFICMGGITCTSAWIFWQIPENVRAKVDQSVSLEE
jgi:MFS family permease